MKKIIKYVIIDILRNKIVLVYTIFLLAISFKVCSIWKIIHRIQFAFISAEPHLIIIPLVGFFLNVLCIPESSEQVYRSAFKKERRSGLAYSSGLSFRWLCILYWSQHTYLDVCADIHQVEHAGNGPYLSVIFVALCRRLSPLTRPGQGIGAAILPWLYFSAVLTVSYHSYYSSLPSTRG